MTLYWQYQPVHYHRYWLVPFGFICAACSAEQSGLDGAAQSGGGAATSPTPVQTTGLENVEPVGGGTSAAGSENSGGTSAQPAGGGTSQGGSAAGGVPSAGGGAEQAGGAEQGGGGGMGPIGPVEVTGEPYVVTANRDGQITSFSMNETNGALTQLDQIESEELLFMNFAEGRNGVLAGHSGHVTSYDLALPAGTITPGPSGATAGLPVGLANDQSGRYVVASNIGAGVISFLPFTGDAFGAAVEFECGKPHAVGIHRNDKWIYVPCLDDVVAQFHLDVNAGTMTPMAPASVDLVGGPRHLEFHPTLDVVYVLLEFTSSVAVFDIDPNTGALMTPPRQTIPATVAGGNHVSSDIQITPNGKWLYAFHRAERTLAMLSVAADGQVTFESETTINRGAVRSFDIDEKGNFLLMGSQSGDLSSWEINDLDGSISLTSELSGMGDLQWTGIRYYE